MFLFFFFTFLTNKQRSNQPGVEVLYQIFIGIIDVCKAWGVIVCRPAVFTDLPLVGIFLAWSYGIIHLLHRECVVRVRSTWWRRAMKTSGRSLRTTFSSSSNLGDHKMSIEVYTPFYSEPSLFGKIHIYLLLGLCNYKGFGLWWSEVNKKPTSIFVKV